MQGKKKKKWSASSRRREQLYRVVGFVIPYDFRFNDISSLSSTHTKLVDSRQFRPFGFKAQRRFFLFRETENRSFYKGIVFCSKSRRDKKKQNFINARIQLEILNTDPSLYVHKT